MTTEMTGAMTAPAGRAAQGGAVWVSVTRPTPGQSRFTFCAPGLTDQPIVLHDYAEMAVALHYSGQPLSRALTVDQVLTLIVRGVLAVGVDRVRAFTIAVRTDNLAGMAGAISRAEWRRRADRFWSAGRANLCTGLAGRVLWPGPMGAGVGR